MTDSDLNEIIERCALYSRDPLGFVRWAFDWGEGELAQHDGPDEWQRDILSEIGARLRDEPLLPDGTRYAQKRPSGNLGRGGRLRHDD